MSVRVRVIAAALVGAAVASGCAVGGEDRSAGGSGAAPGPGRPGAGGQPLDAPPARALDAYASKILAARAARVAAAKRWGLEKTPLAAPPAPERKAELTTRDGFEVEGQENLPPVYTTVPVKEKVVFLTIDDGAEKDPEFLRMMTELDIPYTAFLSDYLVKENYPYFKDMQGRDVALNNHTLNHPFMPGLSYSEQRREICGMQDVIEKRYGKRPTLFRPPYGEYNVDTLRAAKACGITSVPLWNAEAFVDRMAWREWDRDLHAGDIILTHFRGRDDWKGTMPDMIRQMMKVVTDKGFAVARLEDYL